MEGGREGRDRWEGGQGEGEGSRRSETREGGRVDIVCSGFTTSKIN